MSIVMIALQLLEWTSRRAYLLNPVHIDLYLHTYVGIIYYLHGIFHYRCV